MPKSKKRKPRKNSNYRPSAPAPGMLRYNIPDAGVTRVTRNTVQLDQARGMQKSLLPGSEIIQNVIANSGNLDWMKTENRRQELVRRYHEALIENGYGISKEELKSKDLIDMRAVKKAGSPSDFPELPLNNSPEYLDYVQTENMFYRAIPCFREGAVRANNARYIHFQVERLEMDSLTIVLFLQDYMMALGVWTPGVSGRVTLRFTPDTREVTLTTDPESKFLYSRIYRMLDYKAMFKNRGDIEIWEKIVQSYADRTEQAMGQRDTDNLIELAKIFCQYVSLMNFYLLRNRPKIVPGQKKKPVAKPKTPDTPESEPSTNMTVPEPPKRLVRTIGMISVQSEKAPRAVTERNPPAYKIASWKTRGFQRKLKSGKVVWVTESVHHRKALKQDGTVPQSVIQVKNNGAKKESRPSTEIEKEQTHTKMD